MDVAAALARRLRHQALYLFTSRNFTDWQQSIRNCLREALPGKRTALDQEANRLRSLGTQIKEKLLSGSAFDQLVTAAREWMGRLIVVHAVGHGLARRLFVGSVAERTAEVRRFLR